MRRELDVTKLRVALSRCNAGWTADVTPFALLSVEEKRRRLGANPPGGETVLREREKLASARPLELAILAGPTASARFDWRDIRGRSYVTPVRDQSTCGSCVAFGTLAAVETMVRIARFDPEDPIDLSEAQLFYCHARKEGRTCAGTTGGWWPDRALDAMREPGVADEECYPYTPGDQKCTNLCADWAKRVVKLKGWHRIDDPNEMRRWLTRGPLIACFNVYEDFDWYTSGVYRHVSGAFSGGHCVCVVGYDDTQRAWICKNSWGTGWGENGFFRIAYGDCGIDAEMFAPEGVVTNRIVLAERAIAGPALANMADQHIAVAWTGVDKLHSLSVAYSKDASNFTKTILPATSFDGPSIAFFGGRIYIAWTDRSALRNVIVAPVPFTVQSGKAVPIGETSRYGPALVTWLGRLFVAWVGTDSKGSLCVKSSADGVKWGNTVVLKEYSDSSPTLCFVDNTMYLVWQEKGSASTISVVATKDGKTFSKKLALSDSTDFRPAMVRTSKLYLVWTSRDGNHSLYRRRATSAPDALGAPVPLGSRAVGGPAVCGFKGNTYVAWTGVDAENLLNLQRID